MPPKEKGFSKFAVLKAQAPAGQGRAGQPGKKQDCFGRSPERTDAAVSSAPADLAAGNEAPPPAPSLCH